MKIEIWSDISCPFCYIGKRRLENALEQFEHNDKVELSYRSYQLDPLAQRNTGIDIHATNAKKINGTYEQAKKLNYGLAEQAKKVGLNFDYERIVPTNTYDALRLSYYAKEYQLMPEMIEQMMKAHLVDGLDVGDHNTLAGLAETVGLNRIDTLAFLKSTRHGETLANDIEEGRKLGIQGVPFFIFNDKYAISGAQPLEVFTQTLDKAWEEEKENYDMDSNNYCSDGICKI